MTRPVRSRVLPFRTITRPIRMGAAVVNGVVQALVLALAVSVIAVVAAAVSAVVTGSRITLPGVEMWAETYGGSPSVVVQPHGAVAMTAFVVMATIFAVWRVRAVVSSNHEAPSGD